MGIEGPVASSCDQLRVNISTNYYAINKRHNEPVSTLLYFFPILLMFQE